MRNPLHLEGIAKQRLSSCLSAGAAALVLLGGALAQAPAPAPPQRTDPGTTLKVDVKLVNLFVSVLDQHGSPVAGLARDNFQLAEDGHRENIAVFERESELPLSIVLAIDTSLSTRKDIRLELDS